MIERIEINLLPAEYRIHRKSFKLRREIIYPVLGGLVVAVGLLLWTMSIRGSIDQLQGDISTIQQQITVNKPIQNEINQLRTGKVSIQGKIRALERINVNREQWVRLMEELSVRLPEYSWLISVKEENSQPPVLHIEGRTFVFSEVANYMSNLKESIYISTIDLSNIEQVDSKENVYRFSISCTINPDVRLADMIQ